MIGKGKNKQTTRITKKQKRDLVAVSKMMILYVNLRRRFHTVVVVVSGDRK
jgi:hypothetical protein